MSTPGKSAITSHVLDTARGRPAAGLLVRLEVLNDEGTFAPVAERRTDPDGRVTDFLAPGALEARTYRVTFETAGYFETSGTTAFYPRIDVVFTVANAHEHHHIPLLLSPFGYSTYRGT